MTLALIASLIAIPAAWYLPKALRLDLEMKRRYEYHAANFYRHIAPLLKDDETPDEVLRMIEFNNKYITDRRSAYLFLKSIAMVKQARREQIIKHRVDEIHAFFLRRPELESSYRAALRESLFAASFNSPLIWGLAFRFWLGSAVLFSSTPDKTAENVSEGLVLPMIEGNGGFVAKHAA